MPKQDLTNKYFGVYKVLKEDIEKTKNTNRVY